MLRDLLRGRLALPFGIIGCLFAVVAWATEAPDLILVLNALSLPIAAGGAVAYLRVAITALMTRTPGRADILAIGIWLASCDRVLARLSSMAARDLGMPSIYNSDITSTYVFLGVLAGLCFLWAPFGGGTKAPSRAWICGGLIAAAVVTIFMMVVAARSLGGPSPAFQLG